METFKTLKAKVWLLAISTFVLVGTTVSCQKDDLLFEESIAVVDTQIKSDYEVQGGTLHFRDSDAFIRTHKALAKMSHDERIKFAEDAGFKSLLFYQNEFLKVSQTAKDPASFQATLAQYADIVTMDEMKTPVFNVQSELLSSYQDRAGVVFIGKILCQFNDVDQTVVLDGDRSKLKDPESNIVKHTSHFSRAKQARRSSICQYFMNREVQATGPVDGCQYTTTTVKSRLSVYIISNGIPQGNGKYTFLLTPYAVGSAIFNPCGGGFRPYDSSCSLFSHWTCRFYCTEPGQTYGPQNPIYSNANFVKTSSSSQSSIDHYGDTVTFSNVNNTAGGSLYQEFDFPTDSGWYRITGPLNLQNDMTCP